MVAGETRRWEPGAPDSMEAMHAWSFRLGRWMGVEVQLHWFFLLLLALTMGAASVAGTVGSRGFVLWLLILAAVCVREIARSIAAVWMGLRINAILLLPTGGLVTYANGEELPAAVLRGMTAVGPVANLLFGLAIAGLVLTFAPMVQLWARPWISVEHLLRAFVWVNLGLGLLNLLPAVPLDGGRLFRAESTRQRGTSAAKSASGLSRLVALGLVLAGLGAGSGWLAGAGVMVLLAGSLDRQSMMVEGEIDTIRMRDVMLEDFNTLSGADTLEEALDRALHAQQDVFPVVRSGSLVGAVSRQSILDALQSGGNGYVQGVMTKALATAGPEEPVLVALKRMSGRGGAQLVPVVEGERVVGIVTPQNLSLSTRLLTQQRRLRRTAR